MGLHQIKNIYQQPLHLLLNKSIHQLQHQFQGPLLGPKIFPPFATSHPQIPRSSVLRESLNNFWNDKTKVYIYNLTTKKESTSSAFISSIHLLQSVGKLKDTAEV